MQFGGQRPSQKPTLTNSQPSPGWHPSPGQYWIGGVGQIWIGADTIEGFQLKRVRSGVETLLAANRISREIRGHVQSHGLTGIQARHYDGHDYMLEKRHALELLAIELKASAARTKTSKVVSKTRAVR
jgi:hypothetical protein